MNFLEIAHEYPFISPTSSECREFLLDVADSALDACCDADLGLVGSLYESITNQPLYIDTESGGLAQKDIKDKEKRRKVGQFYTPPSVVRYCIDIAFSEASFALMNRLKGAFAAQALDKNRDGMHAIDFKVLDPACGTGNFLTGIIQSLKEEDFSRVGGRERMLLAVASSSLYGLDIDPRAVCLTRVSLLLELIPEVERLNKADPTVCKMFVYNELLKKLRANIRASDSLLEGALLKTESEQAFDLVITNPPYVSFGSRNQQRLPDSTSLYLRSFYQASAEYKIRYYAIFQEIALRYAASGGHALLLVPDSFLTGTYYEKLRAKLIEISQIVSLHELPAGTIPDAVVGRWCVAHYRKKPLRTATDEGMIAGSESNAGCLEREEMVELASYCESKNPIRYALPLALLIAKDKRRFRLVFSDEDRDLLKVLDRLPPLVSVMRGHTGIRSRYGKQAVISDKKQDDNWKRGLVSGSQVTPHAIRWSGDWINVRADLLFKGGFDKEIVENPKIMVRQTGDRLIAAVDDNGFYHLNNIHSFSLVPTAFGDDVKSRLFLFAGLMNSLLWEHIYRLKTREGGRALAQVDIETVETITIPPTDTALTEAIVALVGRTVSLLCADVSAQKTSDLIFFIGRCIDRLTYDLYDLDEELIEHIEKSNTNRLAKSYFNGRPEVDKKRHLHLPDRDQIFQFAAGLKT
ncbi:MAG TPA: N-6 DNA methylase [Candidatus Obscuribacterales bacterium]